MINSQSIASRRSSHHMRRRSLFAWRLPLLFVLGGGGGCAALQNPGAAYVAADRATFDALAPEFTAYVTRDTDLTPDQRDRRLHALQAWETRLTTAEASQNAAPLSLTNAAK